MVKVSVVMSVYNEKKDELMIAINSILKQTFNDFEFIIINDNPQNEILRKTLGKIEKKDKRIKLLTNSKNIGLAESLNKGINYSNGQYIARMDADDISLTNRLYEEVNFLDNNPNIDMVSSNCDYIDENGNIIGQKSAIPESFDKIKKILPIGSDVIHPTVLIRKKVFEKLQGYRPFPTAEDYDLWLRMLSMGYKIAGINKILLHYRIRENSMTHSNTFLLILVEIYQRKLFMKREKYNKDNFSLQNFNEYLQKNNYYNNKYKNKFECYEKKFKESINLLKNKKIISAGIKIINIMCFGTKFNRKRIINFFRYEFYTILI